jgi:hypothetical protein
MRYKLPEGVTSISAGPSEFIADDDGYIDVPDDTPADVLTLLHDAQHHNLTPEPDLLPAETGDDAPADPAAKKPARKR